MEDFEQDFNKTMGDVLTNLGMDQNGYMYKFLLNKLQEDNVYKKGRRRRSHITRGKFNKSQQVEVLLKDSYSRCSRLKELTANLDYDWKYKQYC